MRRAIPLSFFTFLFGSLLSGCAGKFADSPASGQSSGLTVSTLAGSAGVTGSTNATGTAASFNYPSGIAVDSSGNVYVGDQSNNMVREISPGGAVTTLAGPTTPGFPGVGGTVGVAVDSSGNVYAAAGNMIIKIAPGGAPTTLAGSGAYGSTNATGTGASFYNPRGIAVDGSGNVYVADYDNNMIREITPTGVVSTLAGSTTYGSANGTGTAASFNAPAGVAVDASGNVYVADTYNDMIRKIAPGGSVTTLAGSPGVIGSTNATGSAASFAEPYGVAVDNAGNVYVADSSNELVRKITPGGVVTTVAGSGGAGSTNGPAMNATFLGLEALAVDSSGTIYVADNSNDLIREIK